MRFAFRVRARDSKGNLSAWAQHARPAGGTPAIAVGGFGRVVDRHAQRARRAGTGDIDPRDARRPATCVAFLEGPVSADGYTLVPRRGARSPSGRSWAPPAATCGSRSAAAGTTVSSARSSPPNTTQVASDATLRLHARRRVVPDHARPACSTRGPASACPARSVDEVVRTFQLAGRGGIPVDAMAVTANLTVTGATDAGYVSIGPSMSQLAVDLDHQRRQGPDRWPTA